MVIVRICHSTAKAISESPELELSRHVSFACRKKTLMGSRVFKLDFDSMTC